MLWFSSLYHGANNTSRPKTFCRTLKTAEAWCQQQIMPKGSNCPGGTPSLERLQAGCPATNIQNRIEWRVQLFVSYDGPPWMFPTEPGFRGSTWEIPWWTSALDPGLSLWELRFNPWSETNIHKLHGQKRKTNKTQSSSPFPRLCKGHWRVLEAKLWLRSSSLLAVPSAIPAYHFPAGVSFLILPKTLAHLWGDW